MEGMRFRFSCPEENNQQPLLSHQALRPPPTPPTLVQNLHPVTCSSSSGDSDQSARAASVAAAALEHDSHCVLNFQRNNATNNATRGTPESEVAQESVDLLRMLPEARGAHAPRESNPRRANRMYGPLGSSSGGSSIQQQGAQGPAAAGSLPGVQGVHREADESAAEDSSGFCDDSVVYYTSIPCSHNTNRTSLLGGPSTGGSSGASGSGSGVNSDPEERIAFLSSTYSTLNRNKRNNGGAGCGISLIGGGDRSSRGASNVAEYCTSKSHSRSCGNLTCPRGYDKNRLGRSLKQIYPDYKNKRKKQQLRNIKRWTFLTAIFVGIILAITGIIVAFLVYAPFHLGTKQCRSGYVACGETGCIPPQRVCSRDVQCPRAIFDAICNNKTEASKQGFEDGPPITLSPLARGDEKFFEPDPQGWIFFKEGSVNGSRYVTIHKPMTFYEAQDACRDQGGHLAHVNTIREQVFIEEYLKQILTRHNFPSDTLGFWVGARRSRGSHAGTCQYDQWKWVDAYGQTHDAVRGFSAFVPGKPDNFYKPEECLYLTTELPTRDEGFLKWDDAPCDIHGIGNIMAVCEVEQRTIFKSWGS